MTKHLHLKKVLTTLPTIAARQNNLVQLTKKSVLLLLMLATGLVAHAMNQGGIMLQGATQNNRFTFAIQSFGQIERIPLEQGSSHTFNNDHIIQGTQGTPDVTLNGTLNFQQGSEMTDVITATSFTVTIESSSLWFYGATVQTKSGTNVSGCSATVSSNNHTLTVTIPTNKTFGTIIVDYVSNEPFSNSNTIISGINATYIYQGSTIAPEPTVTYNGTVLTPDIGYTVSYANNNGPGSATVTITGTGNYYGTLTRTYTIRNVNLNDFNSLGNNTYEIANKDDLDRLALLVDVAANSCSGLTFKQTANITYSHGSSTTENNFTQIGGYFVINGSGSDKDFSGTYDGQGYTISGIRVYKDPSNSANANKNVALFGRISSATIQNVILTDARITGYRYVGGLVGNKGSGTVQNCLVVSSTITCGNTYVGALFGNNNGTLNTNLYRNCTVNGTNNATNVGVGSSSSSSDMNGARSAHTLTLGENVTATGESIAYQGTTYYASNTTVTLGYDNLPAGYAVTYSLNGTALTGNTFTMPANDNATVNASTALITYNITYDLDGGSVATANPTTYNVQTPTFTLNNPTKIGYTFTGWTGSNGTTPQTTVTIAQGSTGNLNYTAQWTAHTYTLRLHHNDGSNDYTDMAMTYGVAANIQIITRTGYTFANWSTNPDGTGTTYTEGQSVINLTDVNGAIIDLYAQWTANTYTVTLNNQSATTPGTTSVTATYDAAMPAITVPTKTGYTFGGYYTATNGGGTQYYNADGTSAHNWDIASTTTLYAQWTANTYTVTLDNQSATNPGTASVTATYDAAMPAITVPTKTGYTFGGYYTATNGGGTKYYNADGSSAHNWDIASETTLYAQWTANTYTVRLHKNDGGEDEYTDQTFTYNVAQNLDTPYTRTGYTFANWSTNPDGTGTTYTEGQSVSNLTDVNGAIVDLYAQWTAHTYTVHFDANATNGINATGTMSDQSFTYDQGVLNANAFTRTGYTFANWNTEADGSGTTFTDQQASPNVTPDNGATVTLYAQWNVTPWTGSGTTENDPFVILYPSQLIKLSNDVNRAGGTHYDGKYFKLGNNIDMNGVTFDGIGTGNDINHSFDGNFNGDGKTISNVTVNMSNQNNVGFFGTVHNATIRNLILDGASITGNTTVGVLVGYVFDNGSIENCLVMNSSVTYTNEDYYIGVICGDISITYATLTGNHYYNCTLTNGNNTSTTNIGVGDSSGSHDLDGARSVHTLTLPEQVSVASATESVTYDEVTYYAATSTVTFNYNDVPDGYTPTYSASAGTISGNTLTMPAEDVTVTASLVAIAYNITYDLAGGSVATANPTTYNIETATFTLNNPTRTGYTFAGWTGTDLDEPTMTVTIAQGSTGDRSYTATWSIITYNITYDLAGGSVTSANPTTYTVETPDITLNNPTRVGYSFAGWTGTDLDEPTMTVTIAQGSTGDRSYTATWSTDVYTITYDLAGGSVTSANPTTYTVETPDITLNNPTRAGYSFAGWTGTDLDEPTMTVTIAQGSMGDRSYTATWTLLVTYIDADGVEQTRYDYTLLEGSDVFITYGVDNTEAWYVVAHDVTYNGGVSFNGSANLILMDGATLTVRRVSGGSNYLYCNTDLTIYVQSGGTGAIVGENLGLSSNRNMTIHGGYISARAELSNEGIRASGKLTINGGVVSVTNLRGVGYSIYGDQVVINGGVVTTTNQYRGYGIYGDYDVTINGGLVTANATDGACGIGVKYSSRDIILGWIDATDRITSDGYYGKVTVATGQAFVDEAGNYYLSTLTDSQVAAISGQTLIPFTDFDTPFAITYETNGGTLPSGYPETYTFAETVTLPIPTKEDYTFLGWYDNAVFEGYPVAEITAGTALGAKTFYAYWAPKYTNVTYLDADGQPQTVRATVLYGDVNNTGVYEGGVYTVLGYPLYDLLLFTGDATLILPDGDGLDVAAYKGTTDSGYGLFVEGNLTIYGQEKGNGGFIVGGCDVNGNVNIYGGEVSLYNLTLNADSAINLSWTGMENYIEIYPTQGNVHLLKDFMSYSHDEEWQIVTTVLHAGDPVGIADLCNHYLYPYAETIDVSYIDENGDEQIAHDAQVLWGNETSLPGGTYTFIYPWLKFNHEVTFGGNTTIIVPDNVEIEMRNPDGNDMTVNGDLAIYGQEERSGHLGSYSKDGIHATGDVTVSNFYFSINKICSGGDILIVGGHLLFDNLEANGGNGTITLGYLTEDVEINSYGYAGTVVIRAGQMIMDTWTDNLYSGTLTPEQVVEITGHTLIPYLTPITLEVEGYGDDQDRTKWVFIASPLVGSVDVEAVDNLVDITATGEYNLYRFNQSADLEWENYKAHCGTDFKTLVNGRGYLYASKETVTLTFNGVACPGSSKEVALEYSESNPDEDMRGWNLVGNPFAESATIDRSYYKISLDGTRVDPTTHSEAIPACTGVMVYSENTSDSTATFNRQTRARNTMNNGVLRIAVAQNNQRGNTLMDKAIVSFNEDDQLPKFVFNKDYAKVYIPQSGKDYAIACAETTGEIPVNFEATENGTYTISVNPEGVELGYLHLIDNLTGADIDLLSAKNVIAGEDPQSPAPSYTFQAKTTDYASRFRLVFATTTEDADTDEDAPFAFISNGNIIVNGEGTLQIIDMMGHIVRCTSVARNVSTAGMTKGVYVLRLIDGNTIRTQKIVVK